MCWYFRIAALYNRSNQISMIQWKIPHLMSGPKVVSKVFFFFPWLLLKLHHQIVHCIKCFFSFPISFLLSAKFRTRKSTIVDQQQTLQPVTGMHIVIETRWVYMISIFIEFRLKEYKENFDCDLLLLDYCGVLSHWEIFIKMRAAFLALSFLHNSREDGGKKGSSHFDENLSLWWDTTVQNLSERHDVLFCFEPAVEKTNVEMKEELKSFEKIHPFAI